MGKQEQKYAVLFSEFNRPFALLRYSRKNKSSITGSSVVCCAKNDQSRFEIKDGVPMVGKAPISVSVDNIFIAESEDTALDIFYKKVAAYLANIKEG